VYTVSKRAGRQSKNENPTLAILWQGIYNRRRGWEADISPYNSVKHHFSSLGTLSNDHSSSIEMLSLYFFLATLFQSVLVAPLVLEITLKPGSNDLPILTLPYATYKAFSYDVTGDVPSPFFTPLIQLNEAVIYFQEHQICSTSHWTASMTQARASTE
jgi:hypothetical protein